MPPSSTDQANKKKQQSMRSRAGLSLPVRGIADVMKRSGARRVARSAPIAMVAGAQWILNHKLLQPTVARMKKRTPDAAWVKIHPVNLERTERDVPELRRLLRLPEVPRPIGGALIPSKKKAKAAAEEATPAE